MENEDWISFEIKSKRNLIGELGEVIARHILSEISKPCTVYGNTPTADKYYRYEFERDQSIKKIHAELQGALDEGGWDLLVDKYTEDRNFRDKVVLVEVKTHLGEEFDIRGNPQKRLERQIKHMKKTTHYKNVEAKVMKICFTIENLRYMLSPVLEKEK